MRLDSTFVLYGEDASDPRPDLGYLFLNLAGLDVRVFPGGWKEWKADGARPVVRVVSAADLAVRLRRENPGLTADRPPRGLILFDLREPRDFAIGHLPGALSLPFLHFPEDFGKAVAAGWPGADRATMPLVLYCYGIDCVRSRKAGAEAASLGFRDVLWFRGGVQEWRQAGYPLLDSRSSYFSYLRPGSGYHPQVETDVLDHDLRAVVERQRVGGAQGPVAVGVLPAAGDACAFPSRASPPPSAAP